MKLSDGEKLILLMLCDLHDHLQVKSDIDPKLLKTAILHGHLWGLEWEYDGILATEEVSEEVAREVTNVLDMWSFLEEGYSRLSPEDKNRVAAEAKPFGRDVQFVGFDGNNETTHMSAARFLVNEMGRFSRFKGRELNSHSPSLEMHHRMLGVFEPIRRSLSREIVGRSGDRVIGLSADQLITILKAQKHPNCRE